jgi:hypothetical protein
VGSLHINIAILHDILHDLHRHLASSGNDHDKGAALFRRIEASDRQFDLGPAFRSDGRGDWLY